MTRTLQALACLLLVIASAFPARAADDIVNAAFDSANIDLLPQLKLVESTTANPAIELPGQSGQKTLMKLRTRGEGPVFRWVVFTLSNPSLAARDLVISVSHRGFSGSGVFWPKPLGSQIIGLQASGGAPVVLNTLGTDAITLNIEAGATVTYAVEMTAMGIDNLTLWQRAAFDKAATQRNFFRGVVLGIAMFLGIAVLCFFIVKPSFIFPAASLFVWSAIAFLALNAGYRDIFGLLSPIAPTPEQLRAIIEAMLLAGSAATLLLFLDLPRRSIPLTLGLVGLFAFGCGLAVYGWFQPIVSTGITRMVFFGSVFAGLVLAFVYWMQGQRYSLGPLLTWAILAVWTVVAAYACLSTDVSAYLRLVVSTGLVLVLVTMSFALAQFAFTHTIGSHRLFQDSGRRALALAGAELSVWDWQVDEQSLYVGPEITRVIGAPRNDEGDSDTAATWQRFIHPADRAAYNSAIEAAEARGRGTFSQEFRLRRADGTYRWFMLRARAMVDENGVVSRLIGALSDITSLKRSEELLLSDAVRDRVTGLPNRALFVDRLEQAMTRARNTNNIELYVLVVDMDRFKAVNDGLGQEVADSLLNVMGTRLQQLIGPEDTLARLPGDQFAIMFNGRHPPRDLVSYTESVRQTISEPVELRSRNLTVTASIGVAQFRNERGDPGALLKNAEIALYEAKRRGKNMIEFFRSTMRDDRSDLLVMEHDLRQALEKNQIEVRYQPIMRLTDGQIAGFEALVRWRHPTEGVLGPDSFMSVAEETGVISDIGRFVLTEASRQLGIWQRAFRPEVPIFVSVNMSSQQLLNTDLVDEARQIVAREDVAKGTLKLELTESLLMRNPELSEKILKKFKQLGIGLSCDDFGTGYSSLSYLRRLPFDTLKIDRSFVAVDPEDERASIILEAIILLAHDLELDVVAEGIENQEQIDRLSTLGCDFGQGFFIGQPVSAKQVIEALSSIPYGQKERGRGLSNFWERLTRREAAQGTEPAPALAAATVATAAVSDAPAVPQDGNYQNYGASGSYSDIQMPYQGDDTNRQEEEVPGWDYGLPSSQAHPVSEEEPVGDEYATDPYGPVDEGQPVEAYGPEFISDGDQPDDVNDDQFSGYDYDDSAIEAEAEPGSDPESESEPAPSVTGEAHEEQLSSPEYDDDVAPAEPDEGFTEDEDMVDQQHYDDVLSQDNEKPIQPPKRKRAKAQLGNKLRKAAKSRNTRVRAAR